MARPVASLLVVTALALPAAADDERSGVVVPVAGKAYSARLIAVDQARQATFRAATGQTVVPLADVVTWGALVEPRGDLLVVCVDGGLLVAETVEADQEKLSLRSALLGTRSIPLEFLAGVVLHAPLDAPHRDRLLARLAAADARHDRLLLENGDELPGTLVSFDAKAVEFESAGQKLTVETAKVEALAFDPSLVADARRAKPQYIVGLSDGSRLMARGLLREGAEWQITLADGQLWTAPGGALVFVQPLAGRATYLSDLTAESYRHLPQWSLPWPYQPDRSVTGRQLRAGGRPYAKGLGMHSAARLTYRIDKRFRAFAAELAIDDEAGSSGSVVFSVYVDGKQAFRSDVIRGGMPPVPISVDVRGGQRLSLVVEFADRGDELDRADWLDARLIE